MVHGKLSLSLAEQNKAIKVDRRTEAVVGRPDNTGNTGDLAETPGTTNVFNIVKPFPEEERERERDSQLSRQSSVEDTKMDGKSKRKSSGGKSAIKNKIQMRKMMKEANKMEGPSGVLSDGDHDNGQDSVEEKQDSEPMVDDEIRNSNKTLRPEDVAGTQLTPETERRMRDWNSRFSNLKHSFDPSSDREEDPSRSPSTQRHTEAGAEPEAGGSRGRSRFKERGKMGQRSQSAHTNLGLASKTGAPSIVIDRAEVEVELAQSKDDKNKNNTMIARRGSSLTEAQSPKEKSPSIRRFEEETDDEYVQYMNSVDRYRQNNPNPKPFRPVTNRNDAIAAPLRKISDVVAPPVPAAAPAPVRGQIQQPQPQPQNQPQIQPQIQPQPQPQSQPQPQPQPQSQPQVQQQQAFNPGVVQAKSKQSTPVRERSDLRISRSVPKEVIRTGRQPQQKEESQAEILGLVRTNKETGQVEKTNDMDYEDYMNIIRKVRISKENTRVRTEQARLASMYAQELKRQEEIDLEEDRLQLERQKFEEERRVGPGVTGRSYKTSEPSLEKGQLDNIEQGVWS